jgi:hypothetical protein
LYDAPVYRDWAFWLTVGCGAFSGWAIASEPSTGDLPRWLDALLAAAVFAVLFGVMPAFARLQYRRWRWRRLYAGRRQEHQEAPSTRSPSVRAPEASRPAEKEPAPKEAASTESRDASKPSRPTNASISSLSGEALASSSILASCRESLQYPIARSARTLQLAADPKDQYEAILDMSEAISVTLGSTAAAWLRSEGLGYDALAELQRSYERGVAQGTWHSVTRALAQHSAHHEAPLPGSTKALQREKGGSGLLADLRTLLEERNRWAHGARPHSNAEAAAKVAELLSPLERALEKCEFLAEIPWILTQRSSFRRHYGDFDVMARSAMGDHPEFERSRFASTSPLADDTFYALGPRGPIDLTPLVVIRYCQACKQREVCYADRMDQKHGVTLKSFTTGHVIFDDSLIDEVISLLPPVDDDTPPA